MLAVRAPPNSCSRAQPKLSTAHLLPCRIHHGGPVRTSRRYWDPKPGHDGKPEAYFRGRRLRGRLVRVPKGYRGVVVREGEEEAEGEAMEEEDEEEVVKALDEVAQLEELVVWGHETVPEDDNVFIKGLEEWVRFADAIHAPGNSKPIPSTPDESKKHIE